MFKCSLCQQEIAQLFLEKMKGTIIRKPGSSKTYPVCSACQKKFATNEELLNAVGMG